MEQLAVAVAATESVTCAVYEDVPTVVGVPDITPVLALRVRPGGNEPEIIAKVYGGVPPLAIRDEL